MQIIKERPNPEDIEIELISKCKHKKSCFFFCQYPLNTCDYFLLTGHERGCKISECDKFMTKRDAKRKGMKDMREPF